MASSLRVCCCFLLTACAGCVPHYDRYAPVIEGSVLRNGQPVVGATVELAAGSAMTSVAKTDAAGRFKVGPLKEFHIGVIPFFDEAWPYTIYKLTIRQDSVTYVGFSASPGYTSDPAQVDCNLSTPTRTVRNEDWYCAITRFIAPGMSGKAQQ